MGNHTFVLSDNSVNSSGFKVLTSGIILDRFIKNPVMLYAHMRPEEGRDPLLPIGKWENIRKLGDTLLAEADFDMDDPFARLVSNKVEKRILRSASIGINVLSMQDDQSINPSAAGCPIVTSCELFEVSIVDVPANKNSVRLHHNAKPTNFAELSIGRSQLTEFERLHRITGALEELRRVNNAKYNLLFGEFKDAHNRRMRR